MNNNCQQCKTFVLSKIGVGFDNKGFSPCISAARFPPHVSANLCRLFYLHSLGPYNNMRDRFVQSFVGTPCFRFDAQTCFNTDCCTQFNVKVRAETCKDITSPNNDIEVQSNSNAEISLGDFNRKD